MKNNKNGSVVARRLLSSKNKSVPQTREERRQLMYLKKIMNDPLLLKI